MSPDNARFYMPALTHMTHDNPAGRLLSILMSARVIPGDRVCRMAWHELLQTDERQSLLMSRLGKVMELPQAAILALKEAYPDDIPTWEHWEAQVNAGFNSQQLQGPWASFINYIDDHTINYLRMSATLLQGKSLTRNISTEELTDVRRTILAIIDELIESGQPDAVKKYLVYQLQRIVTAIDEYRISGAMPILDLVEGAFGHSLVDHDYSTFLKDDSLGQKVVSCLATAANLVTVATGLPALPTTVALMLRLGC